MSISSRLIAWISKMPPAETYDITIQRDIKVPMPDGAVLLADRYFPPKGNRPTVLIRSPYGRRGPFGLLYGRPFAERGFQVLIQSVRGTFGSGGTLDPFRREQADGLATVEWMRKQDWFNGKLATFGPSYLGLVQWAIAKEAGPVLKAMSTWVTSSEFRSPFYPGESLLLEAMLGWTKTVMTQEGSPLNLLKTMLLGDKEIEAAYRHLPLIELDEVAVGKRVPWWREWLEHNEPGDEWWNRCDFSGTVSEVTVPDYMGGGWYDVFLPQTLRDYQTLKRAGHRPYLHIGPWAHTDLPYMVLSAKEAITWFRAHLLGDRSGLRDMPVRIYVMGANEWRDLPDWPPANTRQKRWYLQPGRALSLNKPTESEPDRYRYDPADPTPGVGGVALSKNKGPKDQRGLEARPDVLVYTSPVLDHDLEIIGPVQAELFVQSSLEHTDFFARLCDVNPVGKSINICDSLVRVTPGRPSRNPDGTLSVCIDLWPTAYRFKQGHCIRLQVSSGAHPRLARNLGSGEPPATATTLRVAEQQVLHDQAHPSAVVLPVQT